jgi:hypothetical protein
MTGIDATSKESERHDGHWLSATFLGILLNSSSRRREAIRYHNAEDVHWDICPIAAECGHLVLLAVQYL